MLKIDNLDRIEHFSEEEEGFRQLDLLYKIYKLDKQREILIKKLHKLQKTIKNNPNENFSIKLEALRTVSDEIVRKKKILRRY